ncbi:2Fe-2S iron-sulfur cluster-binding protein [Aquibium microcysteis]|uniref:2Fe-2S iron-sulfur cluster-binding protein n=1 Tax=Aquibium microcysteis TaxID=675281 RepID=UPI00165CF608|nr:2Fe-2S iron-sulfur cluster-binding protein [Aquibium microcysteis]
MKITFVAADGATTLVEADEGESLMQAAVSSGIDGILGECGGSMMCATCHCYVDDAWAERVGPPVDGEEDMLECATAERRATSRLSCQIRMQAGIDGIVVHLPDRQL